MMSEIWISQGLMYINWTIFIYCILCINPTLPNQCDPIKPPSDPANPRPAWPNVITSSTPRPNLYPWYWNRWLRLNHPIRNPCVRPKWHKIVPPVLPSYGRNWVRQKDNYIPFYMACYWTTSASKVEYPKCSCILKSTHRPERPQFSYSLRPTLTGHLRWPGSPSLP